MTQSLFNTDGTRKYLTAEERRAFLDAASKADREVRTFCGLLAYTGCRISEALALTVERVDLVNHMIVFESLKKRKRGVFRAVPVPSAFLDSLDMVHGLREAKKRVNGGRGEVLWNWSRTTAWRRVKAVMDAAGLHDGVQSTAKGLRHGFGVAAVKNGISLNLAQRWLGHAQISTTAIYADAVGEEEHQIAARMWDS
jgi:integrase/recombinase XerD